jgi:hypothetical protein
MTAITKTSKEREGAAGPIERTSTSVRLQTVVCAVLALVVCVLPSPSWAQGEEEQEEEFVPPPSSKEVEGTGGVGSDLDLYWGGNRKEDVIVNHLFMKGGWFEIGLFIGVILNDAFLTYVPVGGRLGYYFTDSLAVELGGSWTGTQLDSDLTSFLREQGKLVSDAEFLNK